MTKFWQVSLSTIALVASASMAHALDIPAKKMLIKDNNDPLKRQAQVQAQDPAITYAAAGNPVVDGASLHLYSDTDDACIVLADGPEWTTDGSTFKYKNKVTKNSASITDGKLSMKIKSGVAFSLVDDAPQGDVNAQVQFGQGTRYCMHCTTPKKDDVKSFLQVKCVTAACDAEPPGCDPTVTTTSTTTTTTTSTTTTTLPGIVVGALPTAGRMTFMLANGLPGAEAACNSNYPGSHVCKYPELVGSQGAPMTGLVDNGGTPVTSFWAVDAPQGHARQCGANLTSPPDWTYNTGHVGVGGDSVTLNGGTGTLGSLVVGGGANRNCGSSKWVGCCD